MRALVLLLLLPLLGEGLAEGELCDGELQAKYCSAWYGGDYHTACRFCGRGSHCPQGDIAGRKITDNKIR